MNIFLSLLSFVYLLKESLNQILKSLETQSKMFTTKCSIKNIQEGGTSVEKGNIINFMNLSITLKSITLKFL